MPGSAQAVDILEHLFVGVVDRLAPMPELTVDFNGTAHVLSVDDTEPVDAVRHRLSALTDIPRSSLRLCCAGEVLQNGDERICSLRSTTLTAWTQRYSRHRSDSAFAAAEAQRRQEALRREELARPLWQRAWDGARRNWPAVRESLRQVSLRTWVKLAVWFALMLVCRRYRLGQPFVITTLIVLMLTSLGERKAGEASAYTVFNAGMQALPGQLRMEDFEGELRGN